MQLYPSSSAPPSKQAPKDRKQTRKRGRHDATAMTSHTGHQQNHSTNELAVLDIISSSTSHDTNHRTTRSSTRIHARSNVDNAVSITSQTHPRHRPVTKPTSISPLLTKRLLHWLCDYLTIVSTCSSDEYFQLRMEKQSWQWVTFCDPWRTWPISQLTRDPHDPDMHDPVPDHGMSWSCHGLERLCSLGFYGALEICILLLLLLSLLLTNHDEFTTVAFCSLQSGILDAVYIVYSKSSNII